MVIWLPDGQSADALAGAERLRRLFRFFAATQCRGRSLVYETLSQGVADDDALLGLLMRTPGEQRRPSLLFAAVNFLLASHPDAELAAYYPVHSGRRPVDRQLVPAFAAFCAEHAEDLGGLLRGGSTQTNEIRPLRDPPPGARPRQPALARAARPGRGRRQRGPQPALRPLPLPRRGPRRRVGGRIAGPDLHRAAGQRAGRAAPREVRPEYGRNGPRVRGAALDKRQRNGGWR